MMATLERKRIKRKVTGAEFQQGSNARRGLGRYRLKLDCGHEHVSKTSQGIPEFKFCQRCEQLRHGAVFVAGRVLERWDANIGQPLRTEYGSIKEAGDAMRALFKTPKEKR